MKIGRNDPCPCGSGKKYKKCCLNKSIGTEKELYEEEHDDWKDYEGEYETRENYMTELAKSLVELSKDKHYEILKKEGWGTWGPVACMDCDNEENIDVKCFAVKGDLEPQTREEEDMLFTAVKEISRILDLEKDSVGFMYIGDYFIASISTCDKCGSHSIFSDF